MTTTTLKTRHPSRRIRPPELRRILKAILEHQPVPHDELDVLLCDDRLMGELHGQFMGDPSPTDILTFPLGTSSQIIISLDTCRRQAEEFGQSFHDELCLYLIHGVLHLAGYDDHGAAKTRAMRAREQELMAVLRARGMLRGKGRRKKSR